MHTGPILLFAPSPVNLADPSVVRQGHTYVDGQREMPAAGVAVAPSKGQLEGVLLPLATVAAKAKGAVHQRLQQQAAVLRAQGVA